MTSTFLRLVTFIVLLIKTYIVCFSIRNFSPINITDLKKLVEMQGGNYLLPLLEKPSQLTKYDKVSQEEDFPLPSVFRDNKKHVFFDIWVVRGRENRLMGDHHGQMCVSIQAPSGVEHALNMELWRYMSNMLQVRKDDVEIVVSQTNEMARRVIVKGRAITDRECQQRLHANLHSFSLEILEEAGAEDSAKIDRLFFHAEIISKLPSGPAPEPSGEDPDIDWKPNYIKNPTMLDRVLRDLMPNDEVIVRGRLLKKSNPNFIARPLLENYLGRKTLKVRRKILEGVHNDDKDRRKGFPASPRMSCPGRIAGLSVIDTLSQDGSRVISRRVFAPLFQNKTHDFVDELDYSEVYYKTSL